jgi:hypothetical protein
MTKVAPLMKLEAGEARSSASPGFLSFGCPTLLSVDLLAKESWTCCSRIRPPPMSAASGPRAMALIRTSYWASSMAVWAAAFVAAQGQPPLGSVRSPRPRL